MDGELLRHLYHELFHHRKPKTGQRCTHSNAVVLWIYFLAVFHDRSPRWAQHRRNWPIWARHLQSPSYSQLMRRLKMPNTRAHIDELDHHFRKLLPTSQDKAVDGKPLIVGTYSKDPDAKRGRVSNAHFGRGYKLHAIANKHGVIEAFEVTGLNGGEATNARKLLTRIDLGGAIIRGDAAYDSNPTFAAVARAGGRLIAPRQNPGTGLGHRPHHPDRLRAIKEIEHSPRRATAHKRHRLRIEQVFGHLTNLPFGLSPLPNWVRRQQRVERWVAAKIALYHLYLTRRKSLAYAA